MDASFDANGSDSIDRLPDALALFVLRRLDDSLLNAPQFAVLVLRSDASGPIPVHVTSIASGNWRGVLE